LVASAPGCCCVPDPTSPNDERESIPRLCLPRDRTGSTEAESGVTMARTRAWTLSRRALHMRHVPPPRLLRFSKINHAGNFRQPAKQRGGGDGGAEAMGQGALFRCVRLRSRSSLQCALSGEWTWAELLPVLGRQAMSGRWRGTAAPVGNEGWSVHGAGSMQLNEPAEAIWRRGSEPFRWANGTDAA
jgi:hypothetical protein